MNAYRFVRFVTAASLVGMASTAAAQTPRAPSRMDMKGPEAPQGYSVVLVLGDSQSSATSDNVPPAARKALNDMKDFLPYKGYRLLDAQWILGSQRSSSRLRGTDDSEYQLILRGTPLAGRMHVVFQLQEPAMAEVSERGVADAAARAAELAATRDRLRSIQLAVARARVTARENAGSVGGLLQESERLKRQVASLEGASPQRGRAVIDTSFSMDIGETVVVGTSRVRGGDKALIALLTAVARTNGKKD